MSSMFKKIIFVTGLLNINNIRCSDEELNKIKEKINKIYDYGEIPLDIYSEYISKNLKESFNISKMKNEEMAVNIANNISDILKVKISNKNDYFHFIKGSFLLKKYLNDSINNINNLKNLEIINKLDDFTKKYSNYKFKYKDINNKLNIIKDIIEEVKGFLNQTIIKMEIDNLMKRVEEKKIVKFEDGEFEYIRDDYFIENTNDLKNEYKNLESYKEELSDKLIKIKKNCLSKFLKSDDLDLDGYFPKHWVSTKKKLENIVGLKKNIYDYEFDNEGIKNKKGGNVINSSEELQKKFNEKSEKQTNKVLKNITKYNNFENYLNLLNEFNNSINVLNTGDNLNFLDELINNYDNVLKIEEDSINLNTEIHVISDEDREKFSDIKKKFTEQLSILEKIKSIFNEFSNERHNKLDEKINNLKQKYDACKEKSAKIKEIKKEIKTLISEIKPKINILTEYNNSLEGKYKVEIPTISDEDYNKKTKSELNDIENNLENLGKTQEKNLEKQKAEKDQEILATAKDEEESKKIQDSRIIREQISAKIKEICKNFEEEYNPTEEDNKSKIEENLNLKLNEYEKIKNYLENEFNNKKGLSKILQNDLNSEKTKTINNCELKLNRFLQKKKEEEEKNKDKEREENSEEQKNKNIEGNNKGGSKGKCCGGGNGQCSGGNKGKSKGGNNNKSKTGGKCCR